MCFEPVSGWKIQPKGMSFRRDVEDIWYSHQCQWSWKMPWLVHGCWRYCTLRHKCPFRSSLGAAVKSPTTVFWHMGQGQGKLKMTNWKLEPLLLSQVSSKVVTAASCWCHWGTVKYKYLGFWMHAGLLLCDSLRSIIEINALVSYGLHWFSWTVD